MGLFGNIFGKKKSNEHKIFTKFISKFAPSNNLTKPTEEILSLYSDKLPKELLDFWKNYGFGNYGNGLIKVIDPSQYMDSLYSWLGIEKDFTKIPILVTAFGDIYYYRKLSETDEDISLLDIHYRNIEVCTYDTSDFFEKYIGDKDIVSGDLKEDLFKEVLIQQKGGLNHEEIFYFVPALILGGSEEVENIEKGTATVHQSILLQMG